MHSVSKYNNSCFPFSIWFIGLPCAGKSTLADSVCQKLRLQDISVKVLDGDDLRKGINNNLEYTMADRMENIRRVAEISNLFLKEGIITLNAVICPLEEMRKMARAIIGDDSYLEIFIKAPLEVCEQRDLKGLYRMARSGQIKDFTGIDSPFEEPVRPDLVVETDIYAVDESVNSIFEYIMNRIKRA